jgi:predicted DNA-binding transcriptional regulator AlpA
MRSPRLIRLARVAELLDLTITEAAQMYADGDLPPSVMLPGGHERWREEDIESWIVELQAAPRKKFLGPEGRTEGRSEGPEGRTEGRTEGRSEGPEGRTEGRSEGPEGRTAEITNDLSNPLARSILFVLLKNKRWMSGLEIAQEIAEESGRDADHTSGYWRRITKSLRDAGWIETSQTNGYRAATIDSS